MKTKISVLLAAAFLICLLSPAKLAQAQNEKNEMEKLRATMKEFVDAYSQVDIEKISGMYAEDAMYLIEGLEILRGRPAIREYLGGFVGAKVEFKQELVEVKIEGTLAYEVVNQMVTVRTKDKVQTAPNKYIHIWKKQKDGSWKVLIDMVNSRPEPK